METNQDVFERKIYQRLPEAFVSHINKYVADRTKQKISFFRIAEELSISPAVLSRWLAGMGPLKEKDIHKLSFRFGPSIYLTCGLKMPDDYEQI